MKVLTDNGPEFSGDSFNAVLDQYGIQHQYTTPNKPSSNGLVERANRILIELLRVQVSRGRSWYEVLPLAIMTHNTTRHSALDQSPAEFIFTNKHMFRDSVIMPNDILKLWRDGHPSFGFFKFDQLIPRKAIFRGRQTADKFVE